MIRHLKLEEKLTTRAQRVAIHTETQTQTHARTHIQNGDANHFHDDSPLK
jgi:hypothetical protein